MAKAKTWSMAVLNRRGAAVDHRFGLIEEVVDHFEDEDGTHYLQFNADDAIDEGHKELRGLKGKTVEVEADLDGTHCSFTGKIVELDREMGEVEIEGVSEARHTTATPSPEPEQVSTYEPEPAPRPDAAVSGNSRWAIPKWVFWAVVGSMVFLGIVFLPLTLFGGPDEDTLFQNALDAQSDVLWAETVRGYIGAEQERRWDEAQSGPLLEMQNALDRADAMEAEGNISAAETLRQAVDEAFDTNPDLVAANRATTDYQIAQDVHYSALLEAEAALEAVEQAGLTELYYEWLGAGAQ